MRVTKPYGLGLLGRGRECVGNYLRECVGKYLIVTGVAAIVMVLCVGLPVYDGVAQVDDAADDGTARM